MTARARGARLEALRRLGVQYVLAEMEVWTLVRSRSVSPETVCAARGIRLAAKARALVQHDRYLARLGAI